MFTGVRARVRIVVDRLLPGEHSLEAVGRPHQGE
jgi:hypothetical protein